ncbi:MAG TPA: hypothetical protein PKV66_00280 [Candidatus Pelethenecus sp.]|nr:hypothetical protein [Candidatus Pelethenecus sp.]
MTKKELFSVDFQTAIDTLCEENEEITSYDTLKDFIKYNVERDNLLLAYHILENIKNEVADYYKYDYSMGTLDVPMPLKTLGDLQEFCD